MRLSIALLAALAASNAGACTVNEIDIKSVSLGVSDSCRSRSCPRVKGVVTVVNRCANPIGIELHVTGLDSAGNAVWVNQSWPNSTSNVPVGQSALGVDSDGDGAAAVETFSVRVSKVRRW